MPRKPLSLIGWLDIPCTIVWRNIYALETRQQQCGAGVPRSWRIYEQASDIRLIRPESDQVVESNDQCPTRILDSLLKVGRLLQAHFSPVQALL
jgi:hypothetical protein